MNFSFNPLESRVLLNWPEWLHPESAWVEHVPFAMLLVELQRPRALVELGTHRGISYCAFCQAVKKLDSGTRCYAVDTWTGDSQAGFYDNKIFEDLQKHHRQYEKFSTLWRMTFDDAHKKISDGSVDLLHIDGLHTYDAVKNDYTTWLPKLSDRAIVLFHDTMVTERNFGVHQLWRELIPQFPHFNFEHGYGLGILAVGKNQPESVENFLRTANQHPAQMRELLSVLGRRLRWPDLCAEIEIFKNLGAARKKFEREGKHSWQRKILVPARWFARPLHGS